DMQLLDDSESPNDHRDLLQNGYDEPPVDVSVGYGPIDESRSRHAANAHLLMRDRFVDDHVSVSGLLLHPYRADRPPTPVHSQPFGDDRHDPTRLPALLLF